MVGFSWWLSICVNVGTFCGWLCGGRTLLVWWTTELLLHDCFGLQLLYPISNIGTLGPFSVPLLWTWVTLGHLGPPLSVSPKKKKLFHGNICSWAMKYHTVCLKQRNWAILGITCLLLVYYLGHFISVWICSCSFFCFASCLLKILMFAIL